MSDARVEFFICEEDGDTYAKIDGKGECPHLKATLDALVEEAQMFAATSEEIAAARAAGAKGREKP